MGGTASLSAYSTTAQDAAIYLTQTAAVATYQTKLSFGDLRMVTHRQTLAYAF